MLQHIIMFATFFFILVPTTVSVSAQTSQPSGGALAELERLLEETDNTSVTEETTGTFASEVTTSGEAVPLILLSQRYNDDRIIGEILNNGTETADFVEIVASFYDANGQIVGTESGFTDPYTLNTGNKAPFTVLLFGDDLILEEGV